MLPLFYAVGTSGTLYYKSVNGLSTTSFRLEKEDR